MVTCDSGFVDFLSYFWFCLITAFSDKHVVLLQGSEICGYVKNQQLGAENSNFLQ
jgi:hypothetical protein